MGARNNRITVVRGVVAAVSAVTLAATGVGLTAAAAAGQDHTTQTAVAVGKKPTKSPATSTFTSSTPVMSPSTTTPITTAPASSVPVTSVATTAPPETTSPAESPSPTASSSPRSSAACPADKQVPYQGQSYCQATVEQVYQTAWGTGTRVVVRDGTVGAVEGSVATLTGMGTCPAGYWCAPEMWVSITVDFSGLPSVPVVWDALELYGVTIGGTLVPEAYVVLASCDPDYC